MPTSAGRELVGTDAVARKLNISRRSVQMRADTGDLPGFRVGKLWRFYAADIDRYIAAQRRESLSPDLGSPEQ